jgi:hypothetical protein
MNKRTHKVFDKSFCAITSSVILNFCCLQVINASVGPTASMQYGVHSQAKWGDYQAKANSIYSVGGSQMVIRDWWNWADIGKTQGTYDWTYTDAAVNKAKINGQKLIICFFGCPGWANGGKSEIWPASDVNKWKTFIQSAVSRYQTSGVIEAYELWNEQNSPLFFEPDLTDEPSGRAQWQIRADDYASKILIPGYDAVRSLDPGTPVLFGGVTWGGTASDGADNTVAFVNRVLIYSDAKYKFDYIGYHPYVPAYSITSIFDQLKSVMSINGISKRIACTEWGAINYANYSNDEEQSNVFMQNLTNQSLA